MTTNECLEKLENTQSESEWNAICDEVKAFSREHYGTDYPDWWATRVLFSGLMNKAQKNWR